MIQLQHPKRMSIITSSWTRKTLWTTTVLFLIAFAAVNLPFYILGIVGNALILITVSQTPYLITPSNILLTSPAFTDPCVGPVAQPLFITLKAFQCKYESKNQHVEVLPCISSLGLIFVPFPSSLLHY